MNPIELIVEPEADLHQVDRFLPQKMSHPGSKRRSFQRRFGKAMFEGLIISHDPYFSTLLQERVVKLVPQPATLQIQLDESKVVPASLPYDLVILDLDMPQVDTLQKLVEFQEAQNQTLFIVFSGTANVYNRQQALQKGADQFFVKPQNVGEWGEIEQEIATLLHPKIKPVESDAHLKTGITEPAFEAHSSPQAVASPSPLTPQPALKIQIQSVLSAPVPEAPILEFSDPVPENDSERATTRVVIPTKIIGQVTMEGMVPLIAEEDQNGGLPTVESKWKVSLNGELLDTYEVLDPEGSSFLTHLIYLRMADISVALESDYFNHLTLIGPTHSQVLVPDQQGIHHAVLNASDSGEQDREQFIIWCCERAL